MARALPLFLGFLFNWFVFCYSDPGPTCPKTNTSLLNFESKFVMLQHQLRGLFHLFDHCSFRVSEFDMRQGFDVCWWGAIGDDFENLSSRFVISDVKLNKTYKNDTFVVNLTENVTWDKVKVITVWDVPTASNFGHMVLGSSRNGSEDSAPSPSPEVGRSNSGVRVFEQPTMFENCKVLSSNYRVRWTLKVEEGVIDVGLEGVLGIQHYMAFGWADPSSSPYKFMLGADVMVTGFNEDGIPFADDFYVTDYTECTKLMAKSRVCVPTQCMKKGRIMSVR